MVWSPTVATACLGFAASEVWPKDIAAIKTQLSNRNEGLKWLIAIGVYRRRHEWWKEKESKKQNNRPKPPAGRLFGPRGRSPRPNPGQSNVHNVQMFTAGAALTLVTANTVGTHHLFTQDASCD